MSSQPEQSDARPAAPARGAEPAETSPTAASPDGAGGWGPAQQDPWVPAPTAGATAWGPVATVERPVGTPEGSGAERQSVATSEQAPAPRRGRAGGRRRKPAIAPVFPEPEVAAAWPAEPPLSARTGEPRRTWPVVAAGLLATLATLFYAVMAVVTFWGIVHHSYDATFLIRRVQPGEASLPLVLLSVLAVVHLAALAAAAAYAGFQAWNGHGHARWVALAALVVGALAFSVGKAALWGLLPLVPLAALLWLPATRRYNRAQRDFRFLRSHPTAPEPLPEQVYYGPLPRYIDLER